MVLMLLHFVIVTFVANCWLQCYLNLGNYWENPLFRYATRWWCTRGSKLYPNESVDARNYLVTSFWCNTVQFSIHAFISLDSNHLSSNISICSFSLSPLPKLKATGSSLMIRLVLESRFGWFLLKALCVLALTTNPKKNKHVPKSW